MGYDPNPHTLVWVEGGCPITYWRKQNLAERKKLAARLRTAREEAGLKQRDVAYRLGIPQSIVSELETGQRRLDVAELWSLAQLYGKRASWFLDHDQAAKATTRVLLVYDGTVVPADVLSSAAYTVVPCVFERCDWDEHLPGCDLVLVAAQELGRGKTMLQSLPRARVPLILAVPQVDGLPLDGCDAIVTWQKLPEALDLAVRTLLR